MTAFAALILAAATAAAAEPPEPPRPRAIATVRVAATIVRPAIVRQESGLEPGGGDAPTPQVVRREGRVLVEFE